MAQDLLKLAIINHLNTVEQHFDTLEAKLEAQFKENRETLNDLKNGIDRIRELTLRLEPLLSR